ncbi:MAG: nitronate monooxygenase, partial [Gammaproteobacteria bacterium]|nr:nitronate monooxygenase [Gammaproteobacteria bacterium]
CGHYTYRLKDTTNKLASGEYQTLPAEHIINDYLHSTDHKIALPPLEDEPKSQAEPIKSA